MPRRILEFILSDHFMLKCWDRTIEKFTLYKLLPYVIPGKTAKKIIVITPAFYNSKGIDGRAGQCLILVLAGNVIKTGYWCCDPNYLFIKEKDADFKWLFI